MEGSLFLNYWTKTALQEQAAGHLIPLNLLFCSRLSLCGRPKCLGLNPLKQIIKFCSLRTHVCTQSIPPVSSVPQSDSSVQDASNKDGLLVFTSDRPHDSCLMLPPHENLMGKSLLFLIHLFSVSIVFRLLFKHERIVAFTGSEVILI